MPNNTPSCFSYERLEEKQKLIDAQLKNVGIPLRYHLYLGADQNHLEEIEKAKSKMIALKIYMGSSTGDLLLNREKSLDEAFKLAALHDVLVAVHAEDEELLQQNKISMGALKTASFHSQIRNPEVAKRAVAQAIALAEKYQTRLYLVHVSSQIELDLIRKAKRKGVQVFAEAAPHHLFLNDTAYEFLGTKALVNPPLREEKDQKALWEAIQDGTIDTIGTDHAPHTLEEKNLPLEKAPSGFPSIELYLPLLLNAYNEKKISLEQIISLTHTRPQEIFRLPESGDRVLVDLKKRKTVEDRSLHTKAKWSPYVGKTLQGWPRFTILKGKVYDLEKL